MSQNFVHLHNHSSYSLLDGLGRLDDMVAAAREQQMPAMALTDHGNMFGAIEFMEKAKDAGVKPIVGCEVYVSDRPLDERPGPGSRSFHLLLLAENEIGYRNLIKLTTEAHMRGFYRKPRVDHALLAQHNEGLICLSGCASAEVPALILDGRHQEAEERADWYHQIFGDRYYMEIQHHDLEIDAPIIEGVTRIASRLGLALVATNDVHYVRAEHAKTHEILLCIQTQTTMDDPKRMRLETPEFYLKTAEQMAALFGNYPESLSNTLAIAERCNLNLTFGRPQLPRFETPAGQSSEEYLRALCAEGARKRYADVSEEVDRRLQYELDVICKTGFVDYFLLVHDVIHHARETGIAVGPGRGSGAASMVAYCLQITNVEPLSNGLAFERFLNPERVSMPDFDLDFQDDRREELVRYVTEKYGRDRVAQIITFGTLGPRAGVRDVGRVEGMPIQDVDRVAKLVPFMCSKVAKAKDEVPELQQLYDGDPAIRHLLDTVETLEGVARHASTHAAGVVIARDPLAEHVPLYKVPKNEQVITQYAMASLEKIGLLKMDFLGLRTLTVLQKALQFIREARGIDIDIDAIDLSDPSIYELLRTGETFGVFQVDSGGMRRLLRELAPDTFEHIVSVNALYRPGPMEQIPKYVARRHGRENVEYAHPALREVLEPTYGIIVYQDQVMRLFSLVAGYSLGEADLIRRAMGKKKAAELAKHHEGFLDRAEQHGTSRELAGELWRTVEPFAGYAFNKAHAAAYAVITCQTAYLKANFPREYMAGLLSAEIENADKVAEAMAECTRLGIEILPPDINASAADFALEGDDIRVGLCAIKHVGSSAIEAIVAARQESGPFASLEDFCARVDWQAVNKRVIESLARCGALDSFGIDRGRLIAGLDRMVQFGQQLQRAAAAGQVSLFGEEEAPAPVLQLGIAEAASLDDKLAWEHDLLGMYVSPHPLRGAEEALDGKGVCSPSAVVTEQLSGRMRVAGMIKSLRSLTTKTGQQMATMQLAGLQHSVDVVVFNRTYAQYTQRLVDNAVVVVEGKIDAGEGQPRLLADAVYTVDEARALTPLSASESRSSSSRSTPPTSSPTPAQPSRPACKLVIEFLRGSDRGGDLDRIEQVYALLQRFHGADEVEMHVKLGDSSKPLPLPNKQVNVCDQLTSELRRLLPEQSWRLDHAFGVGA